MHIQASLSVSAVSSFIRSLNPEVPIGQILYGLKKSIEFV